MTDKKTGGQAFPGNESAEGSYNQGMSLRDWFAGQALVGISALSAHPNSPNIFGQAKLAYEMADEMLKERDK